MLKTDWPIPANVAIAMTSRIGGVSRPPFDSLNLGLHVGDDSTSVMANRVLLSKLLSLPEDLQWLDQVHGTDIVRLDSFMTNSITEKSGTPQADGCYSNQANMPCIVMTADCLPVLLCNKQGTEVAAVHAGWRGLCNGVIEQAINEFVSPATDLLAFLGPAIGSTAFEVGAEVRQAFMQVDSQAQLHFKPLNDKYLADLNGLAIQRLMRLGLHQNNVHCANVCTFTHSNYFSYRRDKHTGRQASLIWLKS